MSKSTIPSTLNDSSPCMPSAPPDPLSQRPYSPPSHIPNPPIPPPPAPPFCAASPCIFSLTLRLTSKNLLTQRSRHTLSPLLRSGSRYSGGMHLAVQDWESLFCTRQAWVVSSRKPVVVGGFWGGGEFREGKVRKVPVEHVRHHFDLGFRGGDLLGGGELGSAAEEEGHF